VSNASGDDFSPPAFAQSELPFGLPFVAGLWRLAEPAFAAAEINAARPINHTADSPP